MILEFPGNTLPRSVPCELIYNDFISKDIFRLVFVWPGSAQGRPATPKAGQFFMVKPQRSAVFLGRPISVANWQPAVQDNDIIRKKMRGKKNPYLKYLTGKYLESDTITFLIARRGRGTLELATMRTGEEAELTGPLGNAWADVLPKAGQDNRPIALIGGGIGLAPLSALLCEEFSGHTFDMYAGFKTGFKNTEERLALLGVAFSEAENLIIATEDGKAGQKGRIPDFLEPQKYAAVCACGPEPMLKAVAAKCKAAAVPCFASLERRMACGVGACLGCTVKTVNGNRRCCADGPIFNAQELIFDD
jgi:NAD(P)H-flavin reductase